MSGRKIFGTDGVRGIANQHPMTCEVALALGRAVAHQAKSGDHRHKIVIGKDTRLSGYMIEMAFASGVCSMGVDVLLLGPMPTPAVAYLTKDMRADAGVMISASHNSFEDNGIKIFGRDGFKLSDSKELELEQFMEDEKVGKIRPTRENVGKAFKIDDARGRYISFLKSVFPSTLSLEGMRIAIDCADGAAYRVAPMVLEELGAKVFPINIEPNGKNINELGGATNPNAVAIHTMSNKCNIGIALDGDADRLVVVDETGEIYDGDTVMTIIAKDMLSQGKLNNNTLISTVMSSGGLEQAIEEAGGLVYRTSVGDRYIIEQMRNGGYNLGGEQSGHIICGDHSTTGDGMVAALKVLAIMAKTGMALSELAKVFKPVPQALVNVRVASKPPLEDLEIVQLGIQAAENKLNSMGGGKVLVRYSGTENLVRILVESSDEELNTKIAAALSYEIHKVIGAKK